MLESGSIYSVIKRLPISLQYVESLLLHINEDCGGKVGIFPTLQVKIEKPPPAPYEVRLIAWRAKDVPCGDEVRSCRKRLICKLDSRRNSLCLQLTGMNDLYCRAMLQGAKSEVKTTDIHWRAQHGKASWNYRLKWKVYLPNKFPYLTFQIWDQDVFKYNGAYRREHFCWFLARQWHFCRMLQIA